MESLADRRRRAEKRAQSLLFPTARPSSNGQKLVLNETAPQWERLQTRSSLHGVNNSRPSPAGARPDSTPLWNQGAPPCSFPPGPPGPRQGWAAGSDRFWLLEIRVSRTFLDQLRPQLSGHGYPAQRAANGSWRGTPARLTLHPRKREHRVSEKTEDHDVRPDQKLRSGSQTRRRRDIPTPPRHDRSTSVPAGVEIPAGCPAVTAMELDQQ